MRVNRVSMRYFKYVGLVAAVAVFLMVALSGCQSPVEKVPTPTVKISAPDSVKEGQPVDVTITVTPGDYEFSYEVGFEGSAAKSGNIMGSKTVQLTAPLVDKDTDKKIVVKVYKENVAKSAEATIKVKNNVAPSISLAEGEKEVTLSSDKPYKVTYKFSVSDPDSKNLSYELYYDGIKETDGSFEEGKGEISYTISFTKDDEGSHEIKVIVKDELDTSSLEVPIEVKYNPGWTIKAYKGTQALSAPIVLGPGLKEFYYSVKYTGTVDYYVIKIEKDATDVWESDQLDPAVWTDGKVYLENVAGALKVKIGDSEEAVSGAAAGEYELYVEAYVAGNEKPSSVSEKNSFYFYPVKPELTTEVATNNDYSDDILDGEKDIEGTVTINSDSATAVILNSKNLFSVEVGKLGVNLENATFTKDSTVTPLEGNLVMVEFPATLTFKFKITTDATEGTFPATFALVLPDATKSSDSKSLAIDNKKPEVKKLYSSTSEYKSLFYDYEVEDTNFATGELYFYVVDGDKETLIATRSLSSLKDSDTISSFVREFDKGYVKVVLEAYDKVGHKGKEEKAFNEAYLDTGVGKAEFEAIDGIINAATKVFEISAEDNSGIATSTVKIESESTPTIPITVSDASYVGGKLYVEVSFKDSTEAIVDATAIVKDELGNATKVTLLDGAKYDTASPTILSGPSFEDNRFLSFNATDLTFDKIKIVVSTTTKYSEEISENKLVDKSICELIPDLEGTDLSNATIDIYVYDKAGHEASKTLSDQSIDCTVPEGVVGNPTSITWDNASATFYASMITNDNIMMLKVYIPKEDMQDATLALHVGNETVNDFSYDDTGEFFYYSLSAASEVKVATVDVWFVNGAQVDKTTSIKFEAYALDAGGYRMIGSAESDVDLFPKAGQIEALALDNNDSNDYIIFNVSNSETFAASVSTVVVNNSLVSSEIFSDAGTTVYQSDDLFDSSTEESTTLEFAAGEIGYLVRWGTVAASFLNTSEIDIDASVEATLDYLPNYEAVNFTVPVWNPLYDGVVAIVSEPAEIGVGWSNANLESGVVATGTMADGTMLTLDDAVLDSGSYTTAMPVATFSSYLLGDESNISKPQVISANFRDLMDEYAATVVGFDATEIADNTAGATFVIATVTFEFPNLSDAVNAVLTDVATNGEFSWDGDVNDSANNGAVLITDIASDTDYATVTFKINIGNNPNDFDSEGTLTIATDHLMFKWAKDGATFWVTNFNGDIIKHDPDLNN